MSCVDDQSREAGLRRRARALGSSTRFRCEPGVICVADRATGAREKHRAAPKAVAIGLDVGGNRVSGLRAFDHDHTHVSLPWILFLKQETGRLDCASSRCGYLGSSRTCPLFGRAWGRMLVAGLVPTGRVALLNEPWM